MIKNKKASVLVYSLIILSVMLLIAVAFSTTSVISRKNASTTSKSSQSFQIADGGVNLMLKRIKDAATGTTIADLGACISGKITLDSTSGLRAGSTAELTFTDDSGVALTCSDGVAEIGHVKSVGKFADTARAVEVAVAAPTTGMSVHCEFDGTWTYLDEGGGNDFSITCRDEVITGFCGSPCVPRGYHSGVYCCE